MCGELERVRKTLRELGKLLESLRADPAPRQVHKLRTASRRLQAMAAWLDSPKKSRRLLKAIESVRKAAGGVRDTDVLMAHARKLRRYDAGDSLTGLLAYLETARQQHAAELVHVLRHQHHAVLNDLKEYAKLASSAMKRSRTGPTQNQERIHGAATHVMRELGQFPQLDAGNLHEFRLKIKHLRYTLQLDENADPALLAALDDVQRAIGSWHDWHQLSEVAHSVLRLEQDRPLIERIDQSVHRRFSRALAAANALRGRYLAAPLAQYV